MDKDQDAIVQIRQRFQELSPELREAIVSADMPNKIKSIGTKNSLMIDQTGLLDNEVMFVLLGLEASSEFVANISRELHVSSEKALAIATDVNNEIFNAVRTHLQEWENSEQASHDVSAIERAGGFSVEQEKPPVDADAGKPVESTERERRNILEGIENPQSSREQVFKKNIGASEETHVDPIAELLLTKPAARPLGVSEIAPEPASKAPPPVNLPIISSKDEYRESTE